MSSLVIIYICLHINPISECGGGLCSRSENPDSFISQSPGNSPGQGAINSTLTLMDISLEPTSNIITSGLKSSTQETVENAVQAICNMDSNTYNHTKEHLKNLENK